MLTYKELLVKCTKAEAAKVFSRIKAAVAQCHDWRIDEDGIKDLLAHDLSCCDGLFSIVSRRDSGIDVYGVVLGYDEARRGIIIPNIVPCVARELPVTAYNVCFDEFWKAFGKSVFSGLNANLSGGEMAAEGLLSKGSHCLFARFVLLANKQSLHPLDERRWRDFVISMATSRRRVDARQVRCLLLESGWSEESTRRMAERYAYEIAIVRQCKGLGRFTGRRQNA